MRSIKTLIVACSEGMKHEDGYHLGKKVGFNKGRAVIQNNNYQMNLHTDLIQNGNPSLFLTINSGEFLAIAPILSVKHTLSRITERKYNVSDDNGTSREINLLSVRDKKMPGSYFAHISYLKKEDLIAIKKAAAYSDYDVVISGNSILAQSNLIAIQSKYSSVLLNQISIPNSVAKIITEEIEDIPLEIRSNGNTISFIAKDSSFTITFENIPTDAVYLVPKEDFSVSLDRKSLMYSLMSLNNGIRFNNRVLNSKSIPKPDLKIVFKDNSIDLMNINTKVIKVIKVNCNKNKTIYTYGCLLSKVIKDFDDLNVTLSPQDTHGLVVNSSHIIASTNKSY